jgi:hypothetical protein
MNVSAEVFWLHLDLFGRFHPFKPLADPLDMSIVNRAVNDEGSPES